jgi:hypothetical protein
MTKLDEVRARRDKASCTRQFGDGLPGRTRRAAEMVISSALAIAHDGGFATR